MLKEEELLILLLQCSIAIATNSTNYIFSQGTPRSKRGFDELSDSDANAPLDSVTSPTSSPLTYSSGYRAASFLCRLVATPPE